MSKINFANNRIQLWTQLFRGYKSIFGGKVLAGNRLINYFGYKVIWREGYGGKKRRILASLNHSELVPELEQTEQRKKKHL